MLHHFHTPVADISLPERFTFPFCYTPHPLCVAAAKEVQDYLALQDAWKEELAQGKMFGVLVVKTQEGKVGYLAAFSGILAGKNMHPFFVPPVYDLLQPQGFFKIEEEQIENVLKLIAPDKKIFLTGKGRSGLAAKGFANRLMHLGFQAYVIGEISTPHTKAGDLLIITSGSGETDALVSIAKKAKESGLYLGLVTMNPQSTLGKMADGMIILPGDSKGNNEEKHSIQPMGSQFEQMSFLIFDAIVLKLMENWNQTSEQMFMRHADLE